MKNWIRTEYGNWINLDNVISFSVSNNSIHAVLDINDHKEPISTIFSIHESDDDAQNALDKLIQELQ